ncbi:unnamed protein product [Litomosoides sigmodontis]|uniref:Uncharacterized protein n=1 Tax=Litomosoides sigmodontis TaxID=42156 RepID=A0A3P6TKH0_LITSI|nr:unnamed protein product [Litomosoides sigmodontis]
MMSVREGQCGVKEANSLSVEDAGIVCTNIACFYFELDYGADCVSSDPPSDNRSSRLNKISPYYLFMFTSSAEKCINGMSDDALDGGWDGSTTSHGNGWPDSSFLLLLRSTSRRQLMC